MIHGVYWRLRESLCYLNMQFENHYNCLPLLLSYHHYACRHHRRSDSRGWSFPNQSGRELLAYRQQACTMYYVLSTKYRRLKMQAQLQGAGLGKSRS